MRIWRNFLFLRTVVNIPIQTLKVPSVIVQEDDLTARAWGRLCVTQMDISESIQDILICLDFETNNNGNQS